MPTLFSTHPFSHFQTTRISESSITDNSVTTYFSVNSVENVNSICDLVNSENTQNNSEHNQTSKHYVNKDSVQSKDTVNTEDVKYDFVSSNGTVNDNVNSDPFNSNQVVNNIVNRKETVNDDEGLQVDPVNRNEADNYNVTSGSVNRQSEHRKQENSDVSKEEINYTDYCRHCTENQETIIKLHEEISQMKKELDTLKKEKKVSSKRLKRVLCSKSKLKQALRIEKQKQRQKHMDPDYFREFLNNVSKIFTHTQIKAIAQKKKNYKMDP